MVASVVVRTADQTESGLFCLTCSGLIKQFMCRKSFMLYCYHDLQDLLNKKVYYFLGMFMNNYFWSDEVVGSSRQCLYLVWILIRGWRLNDKATAMRSHLVARSQFWTSHCSLGLNGVNSTTVTINLQNQSLLWDLASAQPSGRCRSLNLLLPIMSRAVPRIGQKLLIYNVSNSPMYIAKPCIITKPIQNRQTGLQPSSPHAWNLLKLLKQQSHVNEMVMEYFQTVLPCQSVY